MCMCVGEGECLAGRPGTAMRRWGGSRVHQCMRQRRAAAPRSAHHLTGTLPGAACCCGPLSTGNLRLFFFPLHYSLPPSLPQGVAPYVMAQGKIDYSCYGSHRTLKLGEAPAAERVQQASLLQRGRCRAGRSQQRSLPAAAAAGWGGCSAWGEPRARGHPPARTARSASWQAAR